MKHARKLKTGQIVKVHRYGTTKCDSAYVLVEEAWELEDNEWRANGVLLTGTIGLIKPKTLDAQEVYLEIWCDHIEYLTNSQIPDHVWSALAKRALLGTPEIDE